MKPLQKMMKKQRIGTVCNIITNSKRGMDNKKTMPAGIILLSVVNIRRRRINEMERINLSDIELSSQVSWLYRVWFLGLCSAKRGIFLMPIYY